jgi:hypothetical protein
MKNTLLVAKSESSATTALLEVDRLDTLAHVDPRQALAAVEDRDLPQNHPVFLAAEAAEVDPRQSRVLADLLIELVVGIDADIARDLARQQARANRR